VLVVFIIITPFIGNEYFLTLHLLIVPFIVLHWITNQSVCALTEIEKFITNKKIDDETFFGQLVGPVYKFKTKGEENLFLYLLMGALFTMTYIKLQDMGFVQLKSDWSKLFSRPQMPPPQLHPHSSPNHGLTQNPPLQA
jgi:hypothetical protein